jgi:phage shock protein A
MLEHGDEGRCFADEAAARGGNRRRQNRSLDGEMRYILAKPTIQVTCRLRRVQAKNSGQSRHYAQAARLAWKLLKGSHRQRRNPMGIFSRFTDIVNSNINVILDKAEDPEKIVRLMIQEMEDTLVEVRSTAARAIADKKEIARSLSSLEREAAEWQRKAELALDKNRDDLAKSALAEKAKVSAAADGLKTQHEAIGEGLEKLSSDIVRLEEKLIDAKTRQQAITARHQTASRRLEVRKRLHNYAIDDALIRFDHFERRIDDLEAHAESYDLGGKRDLKQEFSTLESEDAVSRELDELKSRRARERKPGQAG